MIKRVSEFKGRLIIALNERNMRPVDLARRAEISESTVSQYLSGYAEPKTDNLIKISNVLSFNPTWLMGLDVPKELEADTRRLSNEERELVRLYNSVSYEIQVAVMGMLKASVGGQKDTDLPSLQAANDR